MTAIAFALDALGLDMNWSKFSRVEIFNRTDTITSNGMTGRSILDVSSRVEKGIASNHLAWCLI